MKASTVTITADSSTKLLRGGGLPSPTSSKTASATPGSVAKDAVTVDFSASHDVFAAVDKFFDLNSPGKLETLNSLSPEEKGQALKMVVELTKKGFVGYETLRLDNNKVERHDVIMEIGDDRLRNAHVYHDPRGR